MPTAAHPQAKFDPVPPDFDVHDLVDQSPNFDWVVRITISQIRQLGPAGFEKLVQLHVIEGGRPIVIEGWDRVLPRSLFGAKWLEQNYDKKQENVRDLVSQSDIPMTTGHYLRSMRQLTNQWNSGNFRDERRQRLYLKDIDCPPEWYEHLRKVIPPNVFYMNESISENAGADARNGDDIFGAPEPTAATAGDLMSSLPEEMRAQNLMCYIGHEGTYTPAHKEMCASLGQNVMVDASGDENGEKAGSSVWFMTETKDREVVREYFLSMLGHDVEIEKHFAQINAWKKANFPVYVVEQKVGDFILVPPLAPHQVWNRGTRTMKVAWNRTTVETLDLALHEALPRARLVCRDEQYKNKAMIYYTLEKYYKELHKADETAEAGFLGLGSELASSPRLKQMANNFRRLFGLFTQILVDEMFGYKHVDTELIEFDSNITCSYCRSNIFNRFLTCKCCVRELVDGDEDTYDICMECYVMGRSCVCISGLQWCEQWKWSDLVEKHETWRAMVIKQDGFVDFDYSPQPLEVARKRANKKSVAQICQEQLRRRPWNDITKPAVEIIPDESDPEPEVDDQGRVKRRPKPKRKPKKGDTYRCHVCCHKDYTYKLSFCTTCQEAYCYGVLFRAFDIMPQDAMEQEHWRCPRCLGICNCGTCRKTGNTKPYLPRSTLLGHDTRKIADDRSVESVVDFRVHNLSWLKGAGEETRSKDTRRMQRLKEQAEAEKAKDPLASLDAAANDVPHDMDSALQESVMRDYDTEAVQPGAPAADDLVQLNDGPAGSQTQMIDVPSTPNGGGEVSYPEPSPYPDPSIGGRMMGMGFYHQDDSADRILFDAFQEPSADAVDNEPEVSEFVKKTLRLAKRKARLESENDPDFQGPKSHHRKKPKTGNIDQLVNLDPALLGTLGNPTESVATTPTGARSQPLVIAETGTPAGEEQQPLAEKPQPKPTKAPLPIDPLRPQLRHAKPTQSYVEAEDLADDPDDLIVVNPIGLLDMEDPEASEDPLDLAAEAIRTLTGALAEAPASTPQPAGKRRGRPPGSKTRASLPASMPTSMPTVPAEPPTTATAALKPRERPPGLRRTRQSTGFYADNDATVDDQQPRDGKEKAGSPDAESTRADQRKAKVVPARAAASAPTGKRRGRPPGRKSMPAVPPAPQPTPTPANAGYMSMAERMAARGKKFKIRARLPNGETSSPAARQASSASERGVSSSSTPAPSKEVPTAPPTIRQASPTSDRRASKAPTPAARKESSTGPPKYGRKEILDADFEESQEDSDSSPASSPEHTLPPPAQQPGPRRNGPTVVRMDMSSSDGFSSSHNGPTVVRMDDMSASDSFSSSDSDSDSFSDEGIPARPKYTATRGRGGRGFMPRGLSHPVSFTQGCGRPRGRGRGA